MRTHVRLGGTVGVFLGMVAVSALWAAAPIRFQPESRLWVEGTSTVRDFTCQAGQLEGNVDPAPAVTQLAIERLDAAVRGVEVAVPVAALDCRNGTMNGHLRRALKADHHPAIEYRLSSYEVVAGGGEQAQLRMTGRLAMAGQDKPITIEATATQSNDGALQVRGSKEIVMSEWGVKPPSLMMGTMKVRDRVTVRFDVVLRP